MSRKTKRQETYISGTEEYISRIRNKYDAMSDAEKQLADYFLAHKSDSDPELNIKDIASRSNTSVATVVRFCKTLGFKGFSDFKYSVLNSILAPLSGDLRIGSNDEMGLVKQKVAEFVSRNIAASSRHTDNQELERAVEALSRCKRVLISATGTSVGVALAAANAFTYVGIPCSAPMDTLTMLRSVYLCDKDDLVIGITSCGYIKDVVDTLKVARDRKATTICITGVADSLVTKYSDIVLESILEDNSLALDIITASVCQLLILQTMQIGYVTRHNDEITAKMNNLWQLNDMTRYALDLQSIENTRVRF